MKKFLGDLAYILLAVAIVFGTLTLTFPRTGSDVSLLEPLIATLPQPEVSKSVTAEIEVVANNLPNLPPEIVILVLNWWDPDCPYCLKQLVELNGLAELRPDIFILGITMETDPDRVSEVIEEVDLNFYTLYGFPTEILATIPHTHVLIKQGDGVWRLYDDGTWIGVVDVETLLDYIATKERTDYRV